MALKNNYSNNIELIKTLATVLGNKVLEEIVFVGGSVVGLYSTTNLNDDVRFTEDIDFFIKSNSRKDFNSFEKFLREKGFENDMRENAPICRWVYQDITMDAMTADSNILGFTNTWYSLGMKKSIDFKVSNDIKIQILSPEYFIASKLEAHNNRGGNDIRFSNDFSDIVYILNTRNEIFDEIINSDDLVKNFIAKNFKKLLSDFSIEEAIEISLPRGYKVKKIVEIMTKISII